jgi:hypothetical protein
MLIMTFALASAATSPAIDQKFVRHAQSACVALVGKPPRLDDILVERLAATPGDLPKLRITDRQSGGWLLAYYDPAGEHAAYARAVCLGAQLRLVAVELGGATSPRQWLSTVFTTDADYVAPANQIVSRWTIPLEADGRLGERGQLMVVLTMPHEQTHSFQKRAGAELPRWIEEGHAEWVGRKISRLLSPDAALANEEHSAHVLEASRQPVALRSWGAMQVKREAIIRQVPPEERRKMEADTAYTAPLTGRSFSFGPGDVSSDETNVGPRYEASWRMFRDLEAAHGQPTVQSWVTQLTARPGKVDGATAIQEAGEVLHEDLNKRLG